jgi:D-glycero-alpha-D-manno-heptose-7-phosphate kinase
MDIEARRRQLRIMKDMVDEAIEILTGGVNLIAFGELLHEAWLTKRSLSHMVSNDEVDGLYEKALSAGAIGGKLTGAGGGGFLLLFVPPERRQDVLDAMDGSLHVPFEFDTAGSQIIFYTPGVDYLEVEQPHHGSRKTSSKKLCNAGFISAEAS